MTLTTARPHNKIFEDLIFHWPLRQYCTNKPFQPCASVTPYSPPPSWLLLLLMFISRNSSMMMWVWVGSICSAGRTPNFAMLATWKLDIEKDRCGYGFLHNDINWGLNGPLSHLIIFKIWECLGMMTAYIHTKWQLSHFFHHRIVFFTHTHTGMERPMDRLIRLEI